MACNCKNIIGENAVPYSHSIEVRTGDATETNGQAGNVHVKGGNGATGGSIFIVPGAGDNPGKLQFFGEGAGSAQAVLARPSGDAGDLWDVLSAFGLVVAP